MKYKEFKERIIEEAKIWLDKEYAGYSLMLFNVMELYRERDVLKLILPEGTMEAGIYLDKIYEEYQTMSDKPDLQELIKNRLSEAIRYNEEVKESNIVIELKDRKKDRELLKQCPYTKFHGLAILYRIQPDEKYDWLYSCLITQKMAETLGMIEERLYKNALENTKRIYPPIIRTIGESAYEMIVNSSIDTEIRENMPESVKDDDSMYIVTNQRGHGGASYLVYPDVLEKLGECAGSDYYIFPASIYDMYVIPVRDGEEIEESILEAESNAEGLCEEEKLSRGIYYYSRAQKKLTIH